MPEFNVKDINKWLDKRLDEMAQFIFSKSQENLVANGTPDTGILLKSGYVRRTKNNVREIGYLAPYSGSVEYGQPPHPMDPHKLIGWVKRKLGVSDAESLGVAYAVAAKISREGTDPQPFFRPALFLAVHRYKLKGKFSVRLKH